MSAAQRDGNGALLRLPVAQNEQVGNLHIARFANFEADFLVAQVDFRADAGLFELLLKRAGGVVGAVGDGHDLRLHRAEPQRERAGEVFRQDADEALDGAEHDAVNHHRPMLFAVRAGIGEVKALGQVHVQLDGAALPRPTDAVLQMEVDLRTVERAVALVDHIVHAQIVQRAAQTVRGHFPHFVRADGIFGAGGQLHVIRETEHAVHLVDQVVHAFDLVANLLRGHEDVRVVLREAAHAHQAVQRAGELVPVHQSQLAAAQRQIAIRPHAALVDQHAAGAVHGLDGEIGVVDHRGVHVFAVMIPVAAAFPKLAVEHDGRFDFLIAMLAMDFAPVILQLITQNHSLGEEEWEAGALVEDVEQIKLTTQLAMVALLCFLHAGQVRVQRVLAGEGGGVDALKHLVFLAAAPVRAGGGKHLERFDAPGGGQVRPGAQVGEALLPVERNRFALGQVVDQFDLVRLVLHQFQRFRAGQLKAFQTGIFLDDPRHFLFDGREEFGRKRLVHVEIVVEAVVNGGADGELRLGLQGLYGLREHVTGRVPEHAQTVRVIRREDIKLASVRNGLRQILNRAVHARGQRSLFQLPVEFAGYVQRVHAVRKFTERAVYGNVHADDPPSSDMKSINYFFALLSTTSFSSAAKLSKLMAPRSPSAR